MCKMYKRQQKTVLYNITTKHTRSRHKCWSEFYIGRDLQEYPFRPYYLKNIQNIMLCTILKYYRNPTTIYLMVLNGSGKKAIN